MNLHQRMLLQTQRAQLLLNDSSESVITFIESQLSSAGGFMDRAQQPDLYYTVFGIDCSLALGQDLPSAALQSFLRNESKRNDLDLIHLCCLIRCSASIDYTKLVNEFQGQWLSCLETYQSKDGAYNQEQSAAHGSAYACFIVLDAYQSLGLMPPRMEALLQCIKAVRCDDGSYSLLPQEKIGTTPTTCAALLALDQIGEPLDTDCQSWLRSRLSPAGGFVAGPLTPVPDLLSTATALHGLSLFDDDCSDLSERCLDFIDSLWSSRGSFFAYWDDDYLDCEYTFYGLLALGHLSAVAQA